MAETQIGQGALKLSLVQSGLTAGLDSVTKKLGAFREQTKTQMQGWASSLAGFAKGGIAGLAAGFGLGAVTSGLDATLHGIKEKAAVGRTAAAMGVDSAQWMGLEMAFKKVGLEGDQLQTMFGRLGKTLVHTTPEVAGVFNELGLDAAKLANESPDKAFLDIATAIQKIPEGNYKAAAALEIFGKSGAALLPILNQGGDALQKFISKQKSLGNAVGGDDMKKLMQAQQAIPKLGQLWEGFKTKALVALSPVITAVGTRLTKAAEYLMPVFDKVARALSTHWQIIADVVTEVIDAVWSVVKSVGEWIGELFGVGEVTVTMESLVTGAWKAVIKIMAYAWDVLKSGGAVITWVASLFVDGFGYVVDGLVKVLDLANQLPESVKPDWLNDMAKGTNRFADNIHKAGKDMRKWSEGVWNNFGQSSKDVDKWFDKRKNNKGEDLDPVAKTIEESMTEAGKKAGKEFSHAITQGSLEAYEITINRDFEKQMSAQDRQVNELSQIKGLSKEVRQLLAELLNDARSRGEIKVLGRGK